MRMSMKDATAKIRGKRHRVKRRYLGWREVRVWVPNKESADVIKYMAKHYRDLHNGILTPDTAQEIRRLWEERNK
jgi:hypothetical protein